MQVKFNKEDSQAIVNSIFLVKKITVEKDIYLKPLLDLKYSSKVNFINGTINVSDTVPKEILNDADALEFSYFKYGYYSFEVKNLLFSLDKIK